MKSEKFLRLLSGIDSEYVENARKDMAVWEESKEGISVQPAARNTRRNMAAAFAVSAAAVVVGASAVILNVGNMRFNASPNGFGGSPASSKESEVMSTAERSENAITPWVNSTEMPRIKTKVMVFDPDTVYEVLGNGATYLNVIEVEDNQYPGKMGTAWTYDNHGKEFLFLSCGPESVYYRAQSDVNHYEFLSIDGLYYSEPYVKHVDELDGFSKEEAVQLVRETAEKLGITNLGEPSVFAMTAEDANAYYDHLDAIHAHSEPHDESKGDCYHTRWTKDDEAYFVTFPLTIDGLPISTARVEQMTYNWGRFDGSCVMAAVTKDGIVSFDAQGITVPEYTLANPVKINFSKEDILNKFNSNMPDSITLFANKVEVVDCELTYVPLELLDNYEVVYTPVWVVDCASYCDKNYGDGSTAVGIDHDVVMYGAESGERLRYDWIC